MPVTWHQLMEVQKHKCQLQGGAEFLANLGHIISSTARVYSGYCYSML